MPQSVSQLGIVGPSCRPSKSQQQASSPTNQVVEVGPGVDVGFPLSSTRSVNERLASPRDSDGGTTTSPKRLVETVRAEISSTIRISSQIIELSGHLHKSLFVYYWIVGRQTIILATILHMTSI